MLIGIDVTPALATIAAGTEQVYVATARFSDGSRIDVTAPAAWTSSSSALAAMNGNTARGVRPGTVTITAAVMGTSAAATLTVTAAALTSLSVEPIDATLPVRTRFQYLATGLFSDGSKQDVTRQASWSSTDPAIANIATGSSSAGLVTTVNPGRTTIVATLMSASGKATLAVTAATLEALEVTPQNPTLPINVTQAFAATGIFSDGTRADVTAAAAWDSSDPTVLTVSNASGSAGLAVTRAAGTAVVTARMSGRSGSSVVTVSPAVLQRIDVNPPVASVPRGNTFPFTAVGLYSDMTIADLTTSVAWGASNGRIAAVSNAPGSEGVATALAVGDTQIIATLGPVTGSARMTVTSATLVSLSIAPKMAAVPIGLSLPYTATATYSDKTTQDVTAATVWSVSDPGVAGIANGGGNAGTLTGLGRGSATVSGTFGGTFGGKADMAQVTVTDAVLDSIAVTPDGASVVQGGRIQFSAHGFYTDGTSLDVSSQVTWSTDNPMVATVSNAAGSRGLGTAAGPGRTVVRARLDAKEGTAVLNVSAPELASLSVSPINPSRHVGESVQLSASGIYSNGTSQNVTFQATWSSSNPGVATVTGTMMPRGRATCVGTGTAVITATYMGKSDTTTITCTNPTLASLQVTPFSASIVVGQQTLFRATAVYSDSSTRDVTNESTWTSSSPAVADITTGGGPGGTRGLATGLAPGMTTISATHMGVSAKAELTVSDAMLLSIQVTPASLSLKVGQQAQYQAVGLYSDGSNRNITFLATWTSSAPSIADVSNAAGGPGGGTKGQATALAAGPATITASYMGLSDAGTLTVTAAKITSVSVTPVNADLIVGQGAQYQAVALYDDGSNQNVTTLATWTSADTTVVDVSNGFGSKGQLTALKPGSTTVSADFMGVKGSTGVTVKDASLTSLQVTPINITLPKGNDQQYQAVGLYSDGTSRNVTGQATWTSSVEAVASASNAFGSKGVVTALAAGATRISASLSGITGHTSLTVTDVSITEIQVTPTNPTVPKGAPQQFVATAIYSDFTSRNVTADATWSSDNGGIVQVSNAIGSKGRATAVGEGGARVTATFMGKSGSSRMTVTAATVKEVQVTPVNPARPVGIDVQLTATAIMTDNSTFDVTSGATWTSSDESVATVSNAFGSSGRVSPFKAGSAVIKATVMGVSGSTTLTVGAQKLTSISIAPATAAIRPGQTLQLTATGLYDDGSILDITQNVTWISTMSEVAGVSNADGSRGLATGIAVGTTMIEAHFQGKTGTRALMVNP